MILKCIDVVSLSVLMLEAIKQRCINHHSYLSGITEHEIVFVFPCSEITLWYLASIKQTGGSSIFFLFWEKQTILLIINSLRAWYLTLTVIVCKFRITCLYNLRAFVFAGNQAAWLRDLSRLYEATRLCGVVMNVGAFTSPRKSNILPAQTNTVDQMVT